MWSRIKMWVGIVIGAIVTLFLSVTGLKNKVLKKQNEKLKESVEEAESKAQMAENVAQSERYAKEEMKEQNEAISEIKEKEVEKVIETAKGGDSLELYNRLVREFNEKYKD